MTLKNLIDKLTDTDGIVVVVDNHGNVEGAYVDREHFNEYQNCKVKTIRLAEYETTIVTVSGSIKGEKKK